MASYLVEICQELCRTTPVLLLLLLVSVGVALSGCTTLGSYRERVKAQGLLPTYDEVHQWADDVRDAFDSRATMNRQSLYAGALIATSALSILTGIVAFHHFHSDALIGIPIGAGFLGGIATIYHNEEKAQIYSRASISIKYLIALSEKRIRRYEQNIALMPWGLDTEITVAEQAIDVANTNLQQAKDQKERQAKEAQDARQKANAAKNDLSKTPNDLKAQANWQALENSAKALEELDNKAKTTVETAQKVLSNALERRAKAKAGAIMLQARRDQLTLEGKREGEIVTILRQEAHNSEFYMSEASCLQEDVNDVMRKVAGHISALEPTAIAARLSAVKAPEAEGKSDGTPTGASQTVPMVPADLSDLPPKPESVCGP